MASLTLFETKRKEYARCLTKRGNYNVLVTFPFLFWFLRWSVGWSGEGRGGEGRKRGCGEEWRWAAELTSSGVWLWYNRLGQTELNETTSGARAQYRHGN